MKFFSLCLVSVFVSGNCLFAYSTETNFWENRRKTLAQLSPPVSPAVPLGPSIQPNKLPTLLTKQGRFKTDPSDIPLDKRVILHIQDVHLNSEAQERISRTIKTLIDAGRVDLVAVEGAFAPIDLTYAKKFPYPESIAKAADLLLRKKIIAGPFHAMACAVRSTVPFIGIDDRPLYDENVAAVRRSLRSQPGDVKKLADLSDSLDQIKRRAFSPALSAFDRKVSRFHSDSSSYGEYARLLGSRVAPPTPDLRRFLTLLRLEDSLRIDLAQSERLRYFNALTANLNRAELADLFDRSLRYRLGEINHAYYYRRLKRVGEQKGIHLNRYPHFMAYIGYIKGIEELNEDKLFDEFDGWEKSAYETFVRTEAERDLVRLSRLGRLTENLLHLSMTRAEWRRYRNTANVPRRLTRWDPRQSINLRPYEDFYRIALERDAAMAKNLSDQMKTRHSKFVVLVTGGFHAEGVKSNLESRIPKLGQGISVINFVPRITTLEDSTEQGFEGSSYLSVFAQDKSPLQELFDGPKLFLAPETGTAEQRLTHLTASIQHSRSMNWPIDPSAEIRDAFPTLSEAIPKRRKAARMKIFQPLYDAASRLPIPGSDWFGQALLPTFLESILIRTAITAAALAFLPLSPRLGFQQVFVILLVQFLFHIIHKFHGEWSDVNRLPVWSVTLLTLSGVALSAWLSSPEEEIFNLYLLSTIYGLSQLIVDTFAFFAPDKYPAPVAITRNGTLATVAQPNSGQVMLFSESSRNEISPDQRSGPGHRIHQLSTENFSRLSIDPRAIQGSISRTIEEIEQYWDSSFTIPTKEIEAIVSLHYYSILNAITQKAELEKSFSIEGSKLTIHLKLIGEFDNNLLKTLVARDEGRWERELKSEEGKIEIQLQYDLEGPPEENVVDKLLRLKKTDGDVYEDEVKKLTRTIWANPLLYGSNDLLTLLENDDPNLLAAIVSAVLTENEPDVVGQLGSLLLPIADDPDRRSQNTARWLLTHRQFDVETMERVKEKYDGAVVLNSLMEGIPVDRYIVRVEDDPVALKFLLKIEQPRNLVIRTLLRLFYSVGWIRNKLLRGERKTNTIAEMEFQPESLIGKKGQPPLSLEQFKHYRLTPHTYIDTPDDQIRPVINWVFRDWATRVAKDSIGLKITVEESDRIESKSFFDQTGFKRIQIDHDKKPPVMVYEKMVSVLPPTRAWTDAGGIAPLHFRILMLLLALPEEILHVMGDGLGWIVPIDWNATADNWRQTGYLKLIPKADVSDGQEIWHNLFPHLIWTGVSLSFFVGRESTGWLLFLQLFAMIHILLQVVSSVGELAVYYTSDDQINFVFESDLAAVYARLFINVPIDRKPFGGNSGFSSLIRIVVKLWKRFQENRQWLERARTLSASLAKRDGERKIYPDEFEFLSKEARTRWRGSRRNDENLNAVVAADLIVRPDVRRELSVAERDYLFWVFYGRLDRNENFSNLGWDNYDGLPDTEKDYYRDLGRKAMRRMVRFGGNSPFNVIVKGIVSLMNLGNSNRMPQPLPAEKPAPAKNSSLVSRQTVIGRGRRAPGGNVGQTIFLKNFRQTHRWFVSSAGPVEPRLIQTNAGRNDFIRRKTANNRNEARGRVSSRRQQTDSPSAADSLPDRRRRQASPLNGTSVRNIAQNNPPTTTPAFHGSNSQSNPALPRRSLKTVSSPVLVPAVFNSGDFKTDAIPNLQSHASVDTNDPASRLAAGRHPPARKESAAPQFFPSNETTFIVRIPFFSIAHSKTGANVLVFPHESTAQIPVRLIPPRLSSMFPLVFLFIGLSAQTTAVLVWLFLTSLIGVYPAVAIIVLLQIAFILNLLAFRSVLMRADGSRIVSLAKKAGRFLSNAGRTALDARRRIRAQSSRIDPGPERSAKFPLQTTFLPIDADGNSSSVFTISLPASFSRQASRPGDRPQTNLTVLIRRQPANEIDSARASARPIFELRQNLLQVQSRTGADPADVMTRLEEDHLNRVRLASAVNRFKRSLKNGWDDQFDDESDAYDRNRLFLTYKEALTEVEKVILKLKDASTREMLQLDRDDALSPTVQYLILLRILNELVQSEYDKLSDQVNDQKNRSESTWTIDVRPTPAGSDRNKTENSESRLIAPLPATDATPSPRSDRRPGKAGVFPLDSTIGDGDLDDSSSGESIENTEPAEPLKNSFWIPLGTSNGHDGLTPSLVSALVPRIAQSTLPRTLKKSTESNWVSPLSTVPLFSIDGKGVLFGYFARKLVFISDIASNVSVIEGFPIPTPAFLYKTPIFSSLFSVFTGGNSSLLLLGGKTDTLLRPHRAPTGEFHPAVNKSSLQPNVDLERFRSAVGTAVATQLNLNALSGVDLAGRLQSLAPPVDKVNAGEKTVPRPFTQRQKDQITELQKWILRNGWGRPGTGEISSNDLKAILLVWYRRLNEGGALQDSTGIGDNNLITPVEGPQEEEHVRRLASFLTPHARLFVLTLSADDKAFYDDLQRREPSLKLVSFAIPNAEKYVRQANGRIVLSKEGLALGLSLIESRFGEATLKQSSVVFPEGLTWNPQEEPSKIYLDQYLLQIPYLDRSTLKHIESMAEALIQA